MTGKDPQVEVDRARRELARRLEPYVQEQILSPLVRSFIGDLLTEGWRPPTGPPPSWRPGRPADLETTRRGAQLARQALTQTRGDTPDDD